jgi:hypothetical protein
MALCGVRQHDWCQGMTQRLLAVCAVDLLCSEKDKRRPVYG